MNPIGAIFVGAVVFLGGCLAQGARKKADAAAHKKAVDDARAEGKTAADTAHAEAADKAAKKAAADELADLRRRNEQNEQALRYSAGRSGA